MLLILVVVHVEQSVGTGSELPDLCEELEHPGLAVVPKAREPYMPVAVAVAQISNAAQVDSNGRIGEELSHSVDCRVRWLAGSILRVGAVADGHPAVE